MSRALNDLSDRFRPIAVELLARLVEARIPVLIVETRRTPEQHALNLASGVSWTARSKHLDGDAMDLVPYALYTSDPGGDKLLWDNAAPQWQVIGHLAEQLGLRWGGRWTQKDMGHVEWVDATPNFTETRFPHA